MASLSVDVCQVGKSYGVLKGSKGRQVLRDISFKCDRGDFVSIVGASGCGKTTLLRCLAGLEDVSEGKIWVEGSAVCGADFNRAVVFQEPRLYPWLTVGNNVALGLRGHKPRKTREEIRKLVAEKLDFIGLADYVKAYPRSLSGGMAQRVALARALAFQAPVLLLDEPFSSLDIRTREILQEDVLRLWENTGKTIVLVTHDIGEAVLLSQRILILGDSVVPRDSLTPEGIDMRRVESIAVSERADVTKKAIISENKKTKGRKNPENLVGGMMREPSRIVREIEVDLPYPRDPDSPGFIHLRKEISAEIRRS